jgi:hypothetical protein
MIVEVYTTFDVSSQEFPKKAAILEFSREGHE